MLLQRNNIYCNLERYFKHIMLYILLKYMSKLWRFDFTNKVLDNPFVYLDKICKQIIYFNNGSGRYIKAGLYLDLIAGNSRSSNGYCNTCLIFYRLEYDILIILSCNTFSFFLFHPIFGYIYLLKSDRHVRRVNPDPGKILYLFAWNWFEGLVVRCVCWRCSL